MGVFDKQKLKNIKLRKFKENAVLSPDPPLLFVMVRPIIRC